VRIAAQSSATIKSLQASPPSDCRDEVYLLCRRAGAERLRAGAAAAGTHPGGGSGSKDGGAVAAEAPGGLLAERRAASGAMSCTRFVACVFHHVHGQAARLHAQYYTFVGLALKLNSANACRSTATMHIVAPARQSSEAVRSDGQLHKPRTGRSSLWTGPMDVPCLLGCLPTTQRISRVCGCLAGDALSGLQQWTQPAHNSVTGHVSKHLAKRVFTCLDILQVGTVLRMRSCGRWTRGWAWRCGCQAALSSHVSGPQKIHVVLGL